MELLISGVEERLEGPTVGYCLLDRVEFRLQGLSERMNLLNIGHSNYLP